MSIFSDYYKHPDFSDRFEKESASGIDVIIPVFHTNELWYANLLSIYREVPVRRLLISDGGVIDDSIDTVKKFPRVEVFNHRENKTLGKCIADLIREVSSEWFIYLHSDVYLPEKWFDAMITHREKYDWYGCPMNITVMVNYRLNEPLRPYAGSQMGRTVAFAKGIAGIEDDYVYRQEDFIFNKIVEDAGYKTGKVEDTFHFHQVMYRNSIGLDLNVERVNIITKPKEFERMRSNEMQIKGIVKYLDPIEPYVIQEFKGHCEEMLMNGEIHYAGFRGWIQQTNSQWLPFFNWKLLLKVRLRKLRSWIRRKIK